MKSVILLTLLIALPIHASEKTIQLKTGEMPLQAYLEMMSEKLDLQLNASSLTSATQIMVVSTAGPFTREEALTRLHGDLYAQGYSMLHDEDLGFERIVRVRDARDEHAPLVKNAAQLPEQDTSLTFVIPVKHADAEQVARVLRSFSPANARIIPDTANRQVFMTDSARAMPKYQKLVDRMDVPSAAAAPVRTDKAEECEPLAPTTSHMPLLAALIGLVGLLLGFLIRGYVIRRIEGGL